MQSIYGAAAPTPPQFLYDRLRLEPSTQLPPRVEHLLVEESGSAADIVTELLDLPPQYSRDLFTFGGVYFSRIPPTPPPNLPDEEASRYQRFITAFKHKRDALKAPRQAKGKGEKRGAPSSLPHAQCVRRVPSADSILEAGSYLRVHVHPRRFPRCYGVEWRERVIAETPDFVLVDKPAAVTVGGTVDNLAESCAACVTRALGLSAPLRLTHQLDTCTEGCVVLAKHVEFARSFNSLLKARQVRKVYKVLTRGAEPITGRHVHFMFPSRYPPKIVSHLELPKWQRCELDILEVRPHPALAATTLDAAGVGRDSRPRDGELLFESTVELVTGRTHQIRVQFAYMGSPVVGDGMYGTPRAAQAMREFARGTDPHDPKQTDRGSSAPGTARSSAAGEEFGKPAGDVARTRLEGASAWTDPSDMWKEVRAACGAGVDASIGLKAFKIQWEEFRFQSGAPWWEP